MKKLEKILMNYLNFIKKNEISIFHISPSVLKLFPKKKFKNSKKNNDWRKFMILKQWNIGVKILKIFIIHDI